MINQKQTTCRGARVGKRITAIFLVMLLALSMAFATACDGNGPVVPANVTYAIERINDIPENVNAQNRTAFENALNVAQNAFDVVEAENRNQVTNSARLGAALTQLRNFDKDAAAVLVQPYINAVASLLPLVYPTNTVADRDALASALEVANERFATLATFTFRGSNYNIQDRITNAAALTNAATAIAGFDTDKANCAAAVLAVYNLINASVLNAPISGDNRADFYAALSAAQTAFGNLSDRQQLKVSNRARLETLAADLLIFDRNTARNAAVTNVENLINAVNALKPFVYVVGMDMQEYYDFSSAVLAAITAYDLLEEWQFRTEAVVDIRNLVNASLLADLDDAVDMLDDFRVMAADAIAVSGVIGLLNAASNLSPNNATNFDRALFYVAINTAQIAYDNLRTDLQPSVTNFYRLAQLVAELGVFDTGVARQSAIVRLEAYFNANFVEADYRLAEWTVLEGYLQAERNLINLMTEAQANAYVATDTNWVPFYAVLTNAEITDNESVAAVIALISYSALNVTITTANRAAFYAALNAAQGAYNALRTDLQPRVTNRDRLGELTTQLLNFDREVARTAAIAVVDGLIVTLEELMPLATSGNGVAFAAALTAAQNAYNALANWVFRSEAGVNLQLYVTGAGIFATATQQLADFDYYWANVAATIPQLVVTRDGNVIEWNTLAHAVDYTVSFDLISFEGDFFSTVANQTVTANSFDMYLRGFINGFITNVRVVANFTGALASVERQAFLQTPLSMTPTELVNETFLVSDSYTLAQAFRALTDNNPVGANRNEIMAFLADTALGQISNHAAVNVRSRGLSSASALISLARLDVGSDTIVNFNADGSVYESYRLIFASPEGSSTASNPANRRDRVYFDSNEGNYGTVHSQLVGNNAGNSSNRAPQTLPAWQNAQTTQTQLNPGGFFSYIMNPAFMGVGNSAAMGSSGHMNIGTVSRQAITFVDAPIASQSLHASAPFDVPEIPANSFMFTVALNGVQAGVINRWEHRRSGGIAGVAYAAGDTIALTFVICADTLDMVSFRSRSRYNADSGLGAIGNADTRVDTTATFTFYDHHTAMPWTGEFNNPAMPTWAQLGARDPVASGACVVEGTLVTLANGEQVAVETLRPGDMVKVWNFYTGQFDVAPVMVVVRGKEVLRDIIRLEFSDDTYLEFYYAHGFFNTNLREFSRITVDNMHEFIGSEFKNDNGKSIRLINATVSSREVAVYQPSTAFHMALYTNGVLSVGDSIMTHGLVNLFEIDDNLMFDAEFRNALIAEHGLLTFEEFNARLPGLPLEFFLAHNGPYLGLAFALGITTWEDFINFFNFNSEFLPL